MIALVRNLSIFWKIFGAFNIVVLAIVVFQLIFFPQRQINELKAALSDKAEALVGLMAYQAAPALDFDDTQKIKEIFVGVAQNEDFAFAAMFGEDGGLLVEHKLSSVPFDVKSDKSLTEMKIETVGNILLVAQPVKSEGGVRGQLVFGLRTDKLEEESRAIRLAIGGRSVLILAITFFVAFLVARSIAGRLGVMAEVAEKVAHGDLSHPPLVIGTQDDVGRMASAFNRMLISQRNLVKQIADSSVQLNTASTEFAANARQQEQGAREQSSSLEEITSSMAALSDTARVIATNSDSMSQVADEMSSTVRVGQDALRLARSAIGEIAEQNDLIADRINKLYEKSQAIINVVDIIDDISDRLDLLALNAALEGSRVGDVGKGFSLVAQEMRRLAENVIGSTKEIKDTIEEIHRFIQASLEASQQGTATSRQGVEEMARMADSIASIFGLIEQATEAARKITVSTQQQLSSTQQMVAAMGEVAAVSNQGLVSAREVTRASSDMTDLAARLRQQVSLFRIEASGNDAESQRTQRVRM